MIMDIYYKLPKGVPLSQHLKEKAKAYYGVRFYGRLYYIPITKESKKLFGLKTKGRKILIDDYKTMGRAEVFIRDIIDSVYLQMRDTVGAEVHQELSNQIKRGFAQLADKGLERMINHRIKKQLPAPRK